MIQDLTILSYCHIAHRVWIPHWVQQLNRQTVRRFSVLFICHNWEPEECDHDEFKKLDPDIYKKFVCCSYKSEPIIGAVIDHGALLVDTEWLGHFDLDDIIHPRRLELQSRFLDVNPDMDFLNARAIGFNGEDPEFDLHYCDQSSPLLEYLTDPSLNTNKQIKECFNKGYNCLTHGLMIYKPEVLKSIGGFSRSDVNIDGVSPDWATWKKAINAGYTFYRLPELLMSWRLDSSAIRNR